MIDALAETLTNNFLVISTTVRIVGVGMGIAMILGALFQFKKYGETRTMMSTQMSVAGPLVMLFAGAMLVMLPDFIGTALMAFWGKASPLAYHGGPDGYDALIPPILMFVRIIGVGAFIRGLVLLSRSGSQHGQPGTLGKAMIHMLAGLLCVHILGTVDLLRDLLGM